MKVDGKSFRAKEPNKVSDIIRDKIIEEIEKIEEKLQENPNVQLTPKEQSYIKIAVKKTKEETPNPDRDDFEQIIKFVTLIKDKEYIRSILGDSYFKFDWYQTVSIIASTGDINFIKEYVEDQRISVGNKLYLLLSLESLMDAKEYEQYVTHLVMDGIVITDNKEAMIDFFVRHDEIEEKSLQNPELMQTSFFNVYGYREGSLNDLEVLRNLFDKNRELSAEEKLNLVLGTKSANLYVRVLYSNLIELNSSQRKELIKSFGEIEYASDRRKYAEFVDVLISNNFVNLSHEDVVDLIMDLKQFDEVNQNDTEIGRNPAKDYNMGVYTFYWDKYTFYESEIIKVLENKEIFLTDEDKIRLITSTGNLDIYKWCLCSDSINLSPQCKIKLIKSFRDFNGMDDKQYSSFLLSIVPNIKRLNLEGLEFIKLALELQDSEELNKEDYYSTIPGGTFFDEFLNQIVKKSAYEQQLTNSELSAMLIASGNTNLIIENIKYNTIFTPEEKVKMILSMGDRSLVETCIEDGKIKLGENGRCELIQWLNDPQKTREYIERIGLLTKDEKRELVLSLGDENYVRECLTNESLGLFSIDKLILINKGIRNKTEKRRYIYDEDVGLDLVCKEILVSNFGNIEDKKRWMEETLYIKDISVISMEALQQVKEKNVVVYKNYDERTGKGTSKSFYTKEKLIEIKKIMDKLLKGIEKPIIGNEESELRAFLEIVERLANHISYDRYAVSKSGKEEEILQNDCRNMYNGLILGTCVCAGYAEILHNALACLGIDSKCIGGINSDTDSGHEWNQVKIGGKWYNVDLTWERDEIVRTGIVSREILRSDLEFEDHQQYDTDRDKGESCYYSMSQREDLRISSRYVTTNHGRKTNEVEM